MNDEAKQLRQIQSRVNKARDKASNLEAQRNTMIRESSLRQADIARATGLTRGRIAQILGWHV